MNAERRCPLVQSYEARVESSARYHEGLSTLPPATLNKFRKGEPLPFVGYSLVQWVPFDSALWQALNGLSELLQADFARAGIGEYFYFLPAGTFHSTVRDLLLGAPPNQDDYIRAVRSAFDRIGKRRMKPAQMQAADVTFMGESSVAAILHPANRESLSMLIEIRQVVAEELARHRLLFTALEPVDFFGHITLLYPSGELPPEVYRNAKDFVRARSRQAGVIGDLAFDELQLRRFDSMVDWSEPLCLLRMDQAEWET